jgi:cytidine deaminase
MSEPRTPPETLAALFEAAVAARAQAYAPYSDFAVGAAILTEGSAIHAGCNVEVASFPEGWCAETTAIGRMVSAGERRIRAVLVVAGGPGLTTPCGGCRQRLAEFAPPDAPVYVAGPEGLRATFTVGGLLPAGFVLDEEARS